MARIRQTIDYSAPCTDPLNPYRAPDPVKVAWIIDEYGIDAAAERWASTPKGSVAKLGQQGRRILAQRRKAA